MRLFEGSMYACMLVYFLQVTRLGDWVDSALVEGLSGEQARDLREPFKGTYGVFYVRLFTCVCVCECGGTIAPRRLSFSFHLSVHLDAVN